MVTERLHRGSTAFNKESRRKNETSTLPERPMINESVTIIGSGIAGCTTAWTLSEAGYNVRILEKLDEPFGGTSLGALGIHFGGRYPKSFETAKECLNSAVTLKRLMPFAFSENNLRFLIADNSEIDISSYINFYSRLQSYYASLSKVDQVFGPAEEFFRILAVEELSRFNHIQGGIATQEGVFNMDRVRETLLSTLRARGVEIVTSVEAETVMFDQEKEKYTITVRNIHDNRITKTTSDVVINTAGYGARTLDQQLGEKPMVKSDFKIFHDVKLDESSQKAYPFPFIILFPGLMHYIPLGEGAASIVGFRDVFESVEVNAGKDMSFPATWEQQLRARRLDESTSEKSQDIIQRARRFMPELNNAELIDMYPGVAVSFNPEQFLKSQPSVVRNNDFPGYFRLVPTKASHAISLAQQVLHFVVEDSLKKGTIREESSYLQSMLDGKPIAYVEIADSAH